MVTRTEPVVTPERFASGMTWDEYIEYIASPENLRREATDGAVRIDRSAQVRTAYERTQLHDFQLEALRWLADQPDGPEKLLVIAEEWSSDCRRDLPMFARLAEAGGLELRIFTRDGDKFSADPEPTDSPNADLMAMFLNEKRGKTWQSIPVAAFFTKDFRFLYRYVEYPAIYDKDRLVIGHIRRPRRGETVEETRTRADEEFGALQQSPFFRIWASAAVDEMLSALQRRLVLGSV